MGRGARIRYAPLLFSGCAIAQRKDSDALCVARTESSNVACHLRVARKGQDVEVFDTRQRRWRAARPAGAHAGEGSATDGASGEDGGDPGSWTGRLLGPPVA